MPFSVCLLGLPWKSQGKRGISQHICLLLCSFTCKRPRSTASTPRLLILCISAKLFQSESFLFLNSQNMNMIDSAHFFFQAMWSV